MAPRTLANPACGAADALLAGRRMLPKAAAFWILASIDGGHHDRR
jgi:hypothetical protein